MKKGITKNIFTCVVLLALLGLIAAYFLGYKKYTDLAATTRANNEVLQEEVDTLKEYYINEAKYKADMIPMNEQIMAILDKYPGGNSSEDVIMHAVNTQLTVPVEYSSINLGVNEVYKTIDENIVKGIGNESLQSAISFVGRDTSYVNTVTYADLKKVIQAIFDSEYNIGINSVKYSKTGGGKLAGTLELVFYSMTGNGKEYTLPDMTPYVNGTANIFGYTTVEETMEDSENTEDVSVTEEIVDDNVTTEVIAE